MAGWIVAGFKKFRKVVDNSNHRTTFRVGWAFGDRMVRSGP